MADVVLNVIDPLENRFVWKDKSPEQIGLAKRDMADALKGYAVDELQAATRYVILHRKFSTMPTVADILDVVERLIAERKAEQAKPKHVGVAPPREAFLDGLKHEVESAKAWARDWLQKSPLGQESLRDGWCKDLHNIVWQIRRNRVRANKPCEFDDIKLNDIATQTLRGAELIAYFRANCRAANVELERKLVLREKFG